ncbi:hypothetical protein LTR53_016347 [Teratosphaeriaceae sp. CCFEE 6253]|nr:hypothetical protein LTR53_016347 [Teratosphaeriaceae sp. CCFEE 6253]
MAPFLNSSSSIDLPTSNGTAIFDKLLSDDKAMAVMADARIVLPILVIILTVILKIYQILIAKRTLDVLRDIKKTGLPEA